MAAQMEAQMAAQLAQMLAQQKEEMKKEMAEMKREMAAKDAVMAEIAELQQHYYDSFVGTYVEFEISLQTTKFTVLEPDAVREQALLDFQAGLPACKAAEKNFRYVYHCAPADVIPLILAHGLRPSHCEICRGVIIGDCIDCGWFGGHHFGIYVAKHGDYCCKYAFKPPRDPVPGNTGATIMFKTVTGRVKKFDRVDEGALPSVGYEAHCSPNNLEFFMYDDETQKEPPCPLQRCVPVAVIEWKIIRNTRARITDDGDSE
jgi:hypothetical protein